ncbi:MAG TPA: enolase C-terminal domain-like protein [Acidimicrobiia bacterium]
MTRHPPVVDAIRVSAYRVPTDAPESDGTLEWDATTIVVVEVEAGGHTGLGYTYGAAAVADLVARELAPVLRDQRALDIAAAWHAMSAQLRNAGRPGAGMMAISAVDLALWDLKARFLGIAVADLLGRARDAVPVYGSGGFTSYSLDRIGRQLDEWVAAGIPRVKIKVGREPLRDPERLDAARKAIGSDTELFVDANGALDRKQALDWANRFRHEWGVSWFEEPVSSDDLAGMRLLRDRGPSGLDIAAGEYGYLLGDFRALLDAGAVDCLQADVTRCGGITGLHTVLGLAAGHHVDVSAHCAPAVSAHAFCGATNVRHLEYFHDHVRVEDMLFDGTVVPENGQLRPDPERPGLGLSLARDRASRYCVMAASA